MSNKTEQGVPVAQEHQKVKKEYRFVKDLVKELGLDGRFIRAAIRRSGRKAPKVRTSQGIRRLYVWEADSEEYKTVRELVRKASTEVEIIHDLRND